MTSFLERNCSIFVRSFCFGLGQLLLLGLELLDLLVQRLQVGLHDVLALERRAREILAVGGERLTRLRIELHDLRFVLLLLELEALLGGDDVGDPLLDVLKLLDLLLIAVFERLGRVLGPIEQLRDLRLHDGRHAPGQARHRVLPCGVNKQ